MNDSTNANEAQFVKKSLEAEIRELLALLENAEELGVFRSLCRLAHAWNVTPEEFRVLLARLGLRESRASEIKTVLLHPSVSEKFRRSGGPSWKDSLKEARDLQENALTLATRRLLSLLYSHPEALPEHLGKNGWRLLRDQKGQIRFEHPKRGVFEVLRRVFSSNPPVDVVPLR